MMVSAANGGCGHGGSCGHKHHHGAKHDHQHGTAETPKMPGDSAAAPTKNAQSAAKPASGNDTKAQRKSFFDILIDHPVLKGLQAVMSVLMVPMIPLIIYELYKGSTTPFQMPSTAPVASTISLMA